MTRDELVRLGVSALVNIRRLPPWMQNPALGRDMTPVVELVVDAIFPHLDQGTPR